MLKQKDIMDCLPLLASVLGNQYGVTVEIGGSEAYTDGKTIHLPALPLDFEPELIIMIRGFTDHESAHIREEEHMSWSAWIAVAIAVLEVIREESD